VSTDMSISGCETSGTATDSQAAASEATFTSDPRRRNATQWAYNAQRVCK